MTYVQIQASENNIAETMLALGGHGKFHVVDVSPCCLAPGTRSRCSSHRVVRSQLSQREIPTKEFIKHKKAVNETVYWERKLNDYLAEMKNLNVVS